MLMSKKLLFCLFLYSISACAFAQQSIRNARQGSWQSLVYKISADTAEAYIKRTDINIDNYLQQKPFAVWDKPIEQYELLPPGNYVIIAVEENELVAQYYCKSSVRIMPVNDQRVLQFELRDSIGRTGIQADVWMNGRKLLYNLLTNTYSAHTRKADDLTVKVAAGGDTSFFELTALEHIVKSRRSQWWTNFYYRKPVYAIGTPVRLVRKMVTTKPAYWFRNNKYYRKAENGYVIFNQPKYKPGDTLRLKAYIVNKKGKPLKKALTLSLFYYDHGQNFNKVLTKLLPVSPGAYVYDFVLGDSLHADQNYALYFKNKKEETVMSGHFKIEDYLLDEVATYALRSEKEEHHQKDTLVFYASAKDANGLALMDGKARLYLTTKEITAFYQQRVMVPDTLWQQQKPLLVEGDTRFEIPASILPDADMDINAIIEFSNSNNEIQEKKTSVKLIRNPISLKINQYGGYITAEYLEGGISVPIKGCLGYDDEDDMERMIQFPFKEKINPLVKEYNFWVENAEGKIVIYETGKIENKADVTFNRVQWKDTAGFVLYNPSKAQVHYSVFYGSQVIANGSDTAENIRWVSRLSKKRIYTVVWNYMLGGEERKGNNSVALLYKVLGTTINGAENIYPGQTDTITVSVTDYKGKPAADVNLTAVSYNTQFSEDIRVPEPPYKQRYRYSRRILTDEYETEITGFTSKKILGDHQQWRKIFGLDTMLYYQMLFPAGGKYSSSMLVQDFVPQLSIYAVQKGVPQEIYLLYINRQLVWYNGVTDKQRYAFTTPPGYVQIGFRLKDKYVEIDSVYIQPYYKHDMVFDLDQLPKKSKVIQEGDDYTYTEQRHLEQQLFRIKNDVRTNNGYVWQNNKMVYLSESRSHIIGPFQPGDSLQFFKSRDFDFKFAFEPGYEYTLTPQMARLEKIPLFPSNKPVTLPEIKKTVWMLGDTVPSLPVIQYNSTVYTPSYLLANDYNFAKTDTSGTVYIQLPADSSFIYAVLYSIDADVNITRIRSYQPERFINVRPGKYQLVLVTKNLSFLEMENIQVIRNTTTCIKTDKPVYQRYNLFVETLHVNQLKQALRVVEQKPVKDTTYTPVIIGLPMPAGNAGVTGLITDKEGGAPIPGVTVMVKGYNTGTVTNEKGYFIFKNIRAGVYTLIISTVGYEAKALQVTLENNVTPFEHITLKALESALQEVVVVGYGVQLKRNMTGAISVVSSQSITTMLEGRLAGVDIKNAPGATPSIMIRGAYSLTGDTKPLYVLNGVLMDELPAGVDMNTMQMSVLKGEMAVNLYGARAANGVIILTAAEFAPKSLRENFKDYAIWQPNLITGEDGTVKFVTTYPDNITSWQTFVVGMDRKKRITKTSTIVKSFKPMLAQLATPQFLIEGDEANAIGKLVNYTTEPAFVKALFSINNNAPAVMQYSLKAKEAITAHLPLTADSDSVKAQYTLQLSNGYSDGELRKIPVYRRGTEEAKGIFHILNADTSFSFIPEVSGGKTVLYIQNNTLDVLLDELKYLKDYPYFCMEQTASKLTGLLLEKQIRKTLQQPFTDEKQLQQLLSKLQKAQLFNGGWSWWQEGEANVGITTYITRALLPLKDDALVQTNLRNATLFLQHKLPLLKKDGLLDVLYTLSEAGHSMDYTPYLQKIMFDSLTVHQQWQVIAIKQKQQISHQKEWQVVMAEKIATMLGAVHWGEDAYRWQSNAIATTVLAYTILQREPGQQEYLRRIIQYFLENRKNGRWRNTVESASICAAILPLIIQQQPKFTSKPRVTVKTDKEVVIDRFPYVSTITNNAAPVQITKTGGGLMYVTAWQKIFNPDPKAVTDHFVINTRFEKNGRMVDSLQAGEKTVMKIFLNALQDAEYVMIEIPIPAGCTYADKMQSWNAHKEFLKDKLIVFIEHMPKGNYQYSIDLEPRYSGTYHLNAAKAELMYFPTFYGRNEMKRVEINN
jgi:alpha-2-macroglobulin